MEYKAYWLIPLTPPLFFHFTLPLRSYIIDPVNAPTATSAHLIVIPPGDGVEYNGAPLPGKKVCDAPMSSLFCHGKWPKFRMHNVKGTEKIACCRTRSYLFRCAFLRDKLFLRQIYLLLLQLFFVWNYVICLLIRRRRKILIILSITFTWICWIVRVLLHNVT